MKKFSAHLYTLATTFAVFFGNFISVFAQGTQPVSSGVGCSSSMSTLADIFNWATCILSKSVIPLIVTIALVVFMYGVVEYMINADKEEKRAEGRKYMLWGIISLFVMLSIFGILAVLGNTFDLGFGGSVSDITPQF